jgi:hypothetical protein
VNDLVDTTEMYPRTILDLEEGAAPQRARAAGRLHGPVLKHVWLHGGVASRVFVAVR